MRTEMQVEFTYTVDDMKKLCRFAAARDKHKTRRVYLTRWALQIGAGIAFLLYRYSFGFDFLLGCALVINAAIILLLGGDFLLYGHRLDERCRNLMKTEPQWFLPQLLRITPDGIFQRNADGEYLSFWRVVADVTENLDAVHLIWRGKNRDGRQTILTVPRRAFASGDEMRAFADLARGYWNAAQHGATATASPSSRDV